MMNCAKSYEVQALTTMSQKKRDWIIESQTNCVPLMTL